MPDKEMIERCCRAAHNQAVKQGARVPKDYDSPDITDSMRQALAGTVIAIIKAMREPTDKMLKAGRHEDVYGPEWVWEQMIDAVINEH